MSIELKIKSKHLSEEAKIIRFEEKKLLKQVDYARKKYHETGNEAEFNPWFNPEFNTYRSLNQHRRVDVRNENRATYLARAFLAGMPYNQVESKRREEGEYNFYRFVFPRFKDMVVKYGKNLSSDERVWDSKKQKYVETVYLESILKEWCGMK